MSKNRNRIFCLALGFLLIGTCSPVFAVDFSAALDQVRDGALGISALVQGKSHISNLYKKALKLSKDHEVVATTTSLDQLKAYYNDCNGIQTSDLVNILYHSNTSFATTFKLILPKETKRPTADEIDKSYKKFLLCKNITTSPTDADIQSINNEIQTKYYEGYANIYSMSTLNQDNF